MMPTLASPKWVVPFRWLAAALGLANFIGLLFYLAAPEWMSVLLTALATAALLSFAFFPRRLLPVYWLAVAALACVGLAIAIVELRNLTVAPGSPDLVIAAGHAFIAFIFLVMLVEAVQGRHHAQVHA